MKRKENLKLKNILIVLLFIYLILDINSILSFQYIFKLDTIFLI